MVAKKRSRFVPAQGDIIWLEFAPTRGHEQDGRRPAVVVSPASYNRATGLALVVPVTTRAKGYPFEVPIVVGKVKGVALADHVRSVAWRERKARLITLIPSEHLSEIESRIKALITVER